MTAINRLNEGTLSPTTQIPFFDPTNGADRRATLTALADALRPLLASLDSFATQHAAPNANAFSVTIVPPVTNQNVFLALTPTAGFAAATLVLPTLPVDAQQVLVSCTQSVTTLTLTAPDAEAIHGGPTTLAAGAFFRLRFDGALGAWFRVG